MTINNKGAVDWCLFGRFAEEENKNITASSIYTRCSDSCSKIRSSIDYNIKSDPGGFDFCAHNTNTNFTSDAASCATCLYANPDLTILGNILTTVQDMCEKKPGKNYTVPENLSVYAAEKIELSPTSSTTSPTTSSNTSSPPSDSTSSLSKGAIAGVVLGGLVAIILVLGLVLFLLKRKKNKTKIVNEPKDEVNAAQTAQPPNYAYDSVPTANKNRYSYVAEAPTTQGPVEMGAGRDPSELPATRV
ncbi:hypothetical protein N0V94_005931 [Neodidymelliopsis sp. IMI 364377]|nr:hypothetical protein N0V94_005931 [Neodidymelliopsis sp. IMI 364377]